MSIEAMKLALEALESCSLLIFKADEYLREQAITSLRQAIQEEALRNVQRLGQEIEEEAEKQEIYGWVSQHTTKGMYEWQFNKEFAGVYTDTAISIVPVYTHPQPKHEENGVCLKCGLATHGPQPKARTG